MLIQVINNCSDNRVLPPYVLVRRKSSFDVIFKRKVHIGCQHFASTRTNSFAIVTVEYPQDTPTKAGVRAESLRFQRFSREPSRSPLGSAAIATEVPLRRPSQVHSFSPHLIRDTTMLNVRQIVLFVAFLFLGVHTQHDNHEHHRVSDFSR
jgi:hypothetical protein